MAGWDGTERRRHHFYRTLNTEYHLRDDVCVGVRDRVSGVWYEDHVVLGRRLDGSLDVGEGAYRLAEKGSLGNSLWFDAGGLDIVTSTLVERGRPAPEDIRNYHPALL